MVARWSPYSRTQKLRGKAPPSPDCVDKTKTDMAYISIRHELGRYTRYGSDQEEFYDASRDPHEWTNQIDNPKYATQPSRTLRGLVPGFEEAAHPLPSALTQEASGNSQKRRRRNNPILSTSREQAETTGSTMNPSPENQDFTSISA